MLPWCLCFDWQPESGFVNISFALRRSRIFVRYRGVLIFLWTSCSAHCSWRHTACLVATYLFPILNTRNYVIDQQSNIRVKRNLFLQYTQRHTPRLKSIRVLKGIVCRVSLVSIFDFIQCIWKPISAKISFPWVAEDFTGPRHAQGREGGGVGGEGRIFRKSKVRFQTVNPRETHRH